jgi:hypothetical protein
MGTRRRVTGSFVFGATFMSFVARYKTRNHNFITTITAEHAERAENLGQRPLVK